MSILHPTYALLGRSGNTGMQRMLNPVETQLDEISYIAPASAHSGVAMAQAAMAELTSSLGASDPEDCQELADGI